MDLDRRTLLESAGVLVGGGGIATVVGVNGSDLLGDPDDEEDEESVSKSEVSLSEREAIDAATAAVSGTVREVELEREDGTPVYEVAVETAGGTTKEVLVHADDGDVIEVETDDEENEENETDDEENEGSEAERDDRDDG